MAKLVVCIMGQDCEKWIDMCIESVKDADEIVYCDGGSQDETIIKARAWAGIRMIYNPFDQDDKTMNGKQRNFYLDYLKKNFPDDWALCLDADEVVEDLEKIKDFIHTAKPGVYSPKMRHLIQDLSHEDAVTPEHTVPNRLFKISEVLEYPEQEHPVLQPKNIEHQFAYWDTTIWHLAYIPNLWDLKKRYENHLAKSEIHTSEYLKQWYYGHIFGTYPKRQFNPAELPRIILKTFGVDKDELYFANRKLEVKHFIDAIQWKDFFKCKNAIEFGCGRGPRVFAMNNVGIECQGPGLNVSF